MPSDLFLSLSSELDRRRQDIKGQRGRDVLIFPCSEANRLGQNLFRNLKEGGFCTHLVTGHRPWDCRSPYFEAARSAARRGCKIERAFLLPGRYLRHDKILREHMDLDQEAGIRIRVLSVGELIADLAVGSPGSLEFGVWDEDTCCMTIYGTGEATNSPTEWRISTRKEDLRRARRLTDILRERAEVVALGTADSATSPVLEEPLFVSAPIARRIAPELCRKDSRSGWDCSRYHGPWQYLRIFNMLATPAQHAEFFLDTLGFLAREGEYRRVLVSSAADYSMLAHVLWAYRKENVAADVTFTDICETPLYLNRWYAKRVSATVETRACEILNYDSARPFDVVCTHSFLGRFTPARRPSLIAKWRQLLRPGGKVVTVNRVVPDRTKDTVGFRLAQISAFRQKALREAEKWRDFLDLDPEELAHQAKHYAARPRTHRVGSRQEITNLFEGGGFTIDRLESRHLSGKPSQRSSGATTSESAEYAHIVATRK